MRALTRTLRNLLAGVGSVLEVWPAPLPPLRLPRAPPLTAREALCRDGAKVAGDLIPYDPPPQHRYINHPGGHPLRHRICRVTGSASGRIIVILKENT